MRTTLCSVLLLGSTPLLGQQTVYVDAHAPSGGDGSANAPYSSVKTAVAAPSTLSGATVLVGPGLYRGRVVLPPSKPLHVVSTDGPDRTVLLQDVGPATLDDLDCAGSIVEGFTLIKTDGIGTTAVARLCLTQMRRCVVIGQPWFDGVLSDGGVLDHCLVTGSRNPVAFVGHPSGSLSHSILWGNDAEFAVFDESHASGVSIRYCVVDAIIGTGTTTNLATPPLVRSFTARDFHLRSTSPCIDAGDPNAALDPDGTRSDIGPLPFDPGYAPFSVYCSAKVNSLGCTPTIGADGNASFSAPVPFEIHCANELSHKSGFLFYGFAPKSTPYQGGTLCVQGPTRRTSALDAGGTPGVDDCSGVYAYDFNARIQSGSDPALEPGATVFTQFWSRDPASSATSNRSDALRFAVLP